MSCYVIMRKLMKKHAVQTAREVRISRKGPFPIFFHTCTSTERAWYPTS